MKQRRITAIAMLALLAFAIPASAAPSARWYASFATKRYCEMAGFDGPSEGFASPVPEGDGEWSFSFFCTSIDPDGTVRDHWFFDWTFTCFGCDF